MENYNRARLKEAARAAMRQAKPRVWVTTLLSHVIVGAAALFLAYLCIVGIVIPFLRQFVGNGYFAMFGTYDYSPALFDLVASLILKMLGLAVGIALLSLFASLIQYGYSAYALKVWRGEQAGPGTLFSIMPRALRVIGSSFMVGLFTFLWSLIAYVPIGILTAILSDSGAMGEVILSILNFAASIYTVLIALRYAMVPYWIISDRDCGVMESIQRSKDCMRGNKGKYFILELSFIGWYLLLGLIVGILTVIGMVVGILQAGAFFASGNIGTGDNLIALFNLLAYTYGGMGVGALLSWPLSLFLTGYTTISTMGFFDLLAGGGAAQSDAPPLYNPGAYGGYGEVPPVNQAPQFYESPPSDDAPPADDAPGFYAKPTTQDPPSTPDTPSGDDENWNFK